MRGRGGIRIRRKKRAEEFHERILLVMSRLADRENEGVLRYLAETLLLIKIPRETREYLEGILKELEGEGNEALGNLSPL
ncbi:MAG: hypothetical protein DRN78_00120 [Thermoproteota archaeon]|nr:MAG: hypothetical protein DRN78_00120 [Candidatus Korarchaeota archaeon]